MQNFSSNIVSHQEAASQKHMIMFNSWMRGDQATKDQMCVHMHPAIMNQYQLSNANNRFNNASPNNFGTKIATTTLDFIKSEVVKQDFYEARPSDYIRVTSDIGAYMDRLVHFDSFEIAGDFEEGLIDSGSNTRKSTTNTAIEPQYQRINAWAKSHGYSLIDIEQANRGMSAAYSKIVAIEEASAKHYALGLQRAAFLGLRSNSEVTGLLNNSGVTSNTTLLQKPLKKTTTNEFTAILENMLSTFSEINDFTITPDTLLIAESDRQGLAKPYNDSSIAGATSRFEFLENALRAASGNPNFKIKSVQYCDQNYNDLGLNRYALYRSQLSDIEMNLPLPYTTTAYATANNFDFESVCFGQFTGVAVKRPSAIVYFDFANV